MIDYALNSWTGFLFLVMTCSVRNTRKQYLEVTEDYRLLVVVLTDSCVSSGMSCTTLLNVKTD